MNMTRSVLLERASMYDIHTIFGLCTELCRIIPAKLCELLPIFPKMADGLEEAGLSSLAELRRENSNMQESFYTSLYLVRKIKDSKFMDCLLSNFK